MRPRSSRITGKPTRSAPVNMSTRAPVARSLTTAESKISASVSGSPPGRMMSLPPAASETRPGARATAAGTCSATICRISLPLTARLAY